MVIAVASGKGGTGKTMLSLSLAKASKEAVQILDCDVEEPNDHLFFKEDFYSSEIINILVPDINETLCDGCGECSKFCEYNAIATFTGKAMLFVEMCHACGGCKMVCPQKAITEREQRIGTVDKLQHGKLTLVQGKLDVGMAMAPPLIKAVKKQLENSKRVIFDAPPGTSCPAVETVHDSDFVILISEPTPFGLNDLVLAVEMLRALQRPFGVVVNRVGLGDDRIHKYCQKEKIEILQEIPDDRKIAEAYANGKIIYDAIPEYRTLFDELSQKIWKE